MSNLSKTIEEALKDNEPNENIEALLKFYNDNIAFFLSDTSRNIDFMLALIDSAIKSSNTETVMRQRGQLMKKYIIRDDLRYSLFLLTHIIKLCKKRNLSVSKIDTLMEILQRENVITRFVRSHWSSGIGSGEDKDVYDNRINAIEICIVFINKMEYAGR